jgi:hypothetical protein
MKRNGAEHSDGKGTAGCGVPHAPESNINKPLAWSQVLTAQSTSDIFRRSVAVKIGLRTHTLSLSLRPRPLPPQGIHLFSLRHQR